jgi:uncharacterized HhH-GPD family protein
MPSAPAPLTVTGDPDVDALLQTNPLALMIGMLLDQQIPIEWAFTSPHRLQTRMGCNLTAGAIVDLSPDDLEALFRGVPALHRFPANMAKRTRTFCETILSDYAGEPTRLWSEAADGADLAKRLKALPGFGPEKTKIFIAVLAKRFGICPDGWEAAAGAFADPTQARSVADVDDPAVLEDIRAYRALLKAEGKSKQESVSGKRPETKTGKT